MNVVEVTRERGDGSGTPVRVRSGPLTLGPTVSRFSGVTKVGSGRPGRLLYRPLGVFVSLGPVLVVSSDGWTSITVTPSGNSGLENRPTGCPNE